MRRFPYKSNHTRSGFLLLMLIAFASILLGLATTFYYYTSRGMDDSQTAIRIAQQRLALSAALNALSLKSASDFLPSSGDLNATQLSVSGIPRTQRMGWYRIARADNTYTTSNWGVDYNDTTSVFITAGTGPSGGKVTTMNSRDWQFEQRSWYLVNLTKLAMPAGPGQAGAIIPVFPPPALYPAGTIIYW